MKTLLLIPLIALTGCASFTTKQKESRNETEGTVEISTTVKARTLWESKSQLSNFKASQTEKTQGASVGTLSQESNGTNTVEALKSIERILQSVK